jgi:DNA invertase Pin-like site-specific DNA recombinase
MPKRRRPSSAATQYWIGYCRKSTDSEDKQIHTLRDQAVMIQAYYEQLPVLERQGRPLKLLEEARSAYHPGRPVFRAVMDMADRGEVHGLIVVHPNRVSRNHADSGAFVQRLVERRIRYLATTGGQRYTADDSNAIFMLTLEGAMSWKDSRDKGDRVLQAMRMRAAEGKHMGQARVGYRNVYRPDGTKTLEVVPEAAPLLRRLFALAATGSYSVQALVQEAQTLGLRGRSGNKLIKPTVYKMLRHPIYKGFVRFDGIVVKGHHEAIVDEETWDRAQVVLSGRSTNAGRPKNLGLRELFVFGNLLKCPRCGRTLCAYRVKGRYIYYECKNPETACGVLVPQPVLVQQLPLLLRGVEVNPVELDGLRAQLLELHQERSGGEIGRRSTLNTAYEQTVKEIGQVFMQRKDAEAMGILAEVDARLTELRRQRDELQAQLNAGHENGNAWIEKVIRSFELIELLREAILFGSAGPREMALKAIASNYSVEGKKLVWEPRSPFRQAEKKGGRLDWCREGDDVRTDRAIAMAMLVSALSEYFFQMRGNRVMARRCWYQAKLRLTVQKRYR